MDYISHVSTMASSAGSSTGLSATWTMMSIPPSLVRQIVDVVKASLAAETAADQPSSHCLLFHLFGAFPKTFSSHSAMYLVHSPSRFLCLWTLLFNFAPIQCYYYCGPCHFLHQHSALVPPSLCLWNCWVWTQLLPLFQFCINLLLWALAFPQVPQKSWARSSLGNSSSWATEP